jgi:hypothetical protein
VRAELGRLQQALCGPLLDLAGGRKPWPWPARRFVIGSTATVRTQALTRPRLRAPASGGSEAAAPFRHEASCAVVLVFRYLHGRPPEIVRAPPNGLLLYETFTREHRQIAQHPSNPAFLLEPGELAALFPALVTLSAEEARVSAPAPEAVARLVARKG